MLEIAIETGHLERPRGRFARLRTFLYADDAAIFISPSERDVLTTCQLLQSFGNVSGLQTNFQKSMVVPISCDNTDLEVVLLHFPTIKSTFPIKYLGLPLDFKRPRKVHFYPLLDKVGTRLAGWQGRLLTPASRTTLVKSVLASMPTYYITVLKNQKGILHAMDRIRRCFLWAGIDAISEGKCKVNWEKVCQPTQLRGLGALNLQNFAIALRLHWL